MTSSKWESGYQALEKKYIGLLEDKKTLVHKVEERVAKVDDQVEKQLKQAIEQQKQTHQIEIETLQQQISELEKLNLNLESELSEQKALVVETSEKNESLNRQADMQASMFERSREIFQRELKVKQQLEALQKEKDDLQPRIEELKKTCDAYLDGTSWEATSDSCDRQDEANSRLSQVNQMIRVHQMDLEQIQSLADQLGL